MEKINVCRNVDCNKLSYYDENGVDAMTLSTIDIDEFIKAYNINNGVSQID